MRRKLLLFFLFAFFVILVREAYPCSCSSFRTERKAFRKAEHVFIGEVLNSDLNAIAPEDLYGRVAEKVRFQILKPWKGTSAGELEVWHEYSSSACGAKVLKGKYLVYAYKAQSGLFFSMGCDRSRRFAEDDPISIKAASKLDGFGFRLWARINPF